MVRWLHTLRGVRADYEKLSLTETIRKKKEIRFVKTRDCVLIGFAGPTKISRRAQLLWRFYATCARSNNNALKTSYVLHKTHTGNCTSFHRTRRYIMFGKSCWTLFRTQILEIRIDRVQRISIPEVFAKTIISSAVGSLLVVYHSNYKYYSSLRCCFFVFQS